MLDDYAPLSEVRLHYVEQGSGPLIVLLHGWPEFWFAWRHQIPALAASGFRVVAPDLRGFNLSDKPKSVAAYGLRRVAQDVAELIEFLGERDAVVVGHDWGAMTAWTVAMHHPERVRRLVVMNSPHPYAFPRAMWSPTQLWRSSYAVLFQLGLLPELVLSSFDYAVLREVYRRQPQKPFSDDEIAEYLVAFKQPHALARSLNYYRAFTRQALLRRTPPKVSAKTLVIWGERDSALAPWLAEPAAEWVSDVEVERVDNAGHFVHADAPERVSTLIAGFAES